MNYGTAKYDQNMKLCSRREAETEVEGDVQTLKAGVNLRLNLVST